MLVRGGVTSFGKGYNEFLFSSIEDARSVRSAVHGSLTLDY